MFCEAARSQTWPSSSSPMAEGAGSLDMVGKPVSPMERTPAHALDFDSFIADVVGKYRSNLLGSGQKNRGGF